MCGRYFFAIDQLPDFHILKKKIDQLALFEYAQEEVFPSNRALVLLPDGNDFTLGVMTWGIKGYRGNMLINARSETINQKKTFSSMRENRCLVPANGFYEWLKKDKKKQKIYIRKEGEPVMYLAGIYNEQNEFVIVTGESDEEMKTIHNRTPIIVKEDEISSYLHRELDYQVDNHHLTFTKEEKKQHHDQLGLFDEREDQ